MIVSGVRRPSSVRRPSTLLRARRNEKDLKVKPATSFKYFQYLLTKLKQSSRQRKYNLTVPSSLRIFLKINPFKSL